MKASFLALLVLSSTLLTGCPSNGTGNNPSSALLDGVRLLQKTSEELLSQSGLPYEAILIKRQLADHEKFSTSNLGEITTEVERDTNHVVRRIYSVQLFGLRKGSAPQTERSLLLTRKVRCSRTEYPSYGYGTPSSKYPGVATGVGGGRYMYDGNKEPHFPSYGGSAEQFPPGTHCEVFF